MLELGLLDYLKQFLYPSIKVSLFSFSFSVARHIWPVYLKWRAPAVDDPAHGTFRDSSARLLRLISIHTHHTFIFIYLLSFSPNLPFSVFLLL